MKGFKEFITRGNVVDLAVAVVIGAAFTAIISTVVDALINPLIGLFFKADSLNKALQVTVPTLGGGHSTFAFGAVIGAVIHFVIIAAVVYFVLVMPMSKYLARQAAKREQEEAAEAALPTEQELLVQIRDLLEKQNKA